MDLTFFRGVWRRATTRRQHAPASVAAEPGNVPCDMALASMPEPFATLGRRAGGLWALLVGLAPFGLAAAAWSPSSSGVRGPRVGLHLLLSLTGVPDPWCGATRSFVLFVHRDARFVDYNPTWLAVAGAVALWGVVLIGRAARRRPPFGAVALRLAAATARRPRLGLVIALMPVAVGWIVALAHLDAIRQY